jgi:hypothetical protein
LHQIVKPDVENSTAFLRHRNLINRGVYSDLVISDRLHWVEILRNIVIGVRLFLCVK